MRKRSGFTLIELLIVVVIIGILAAIAIPKFANTKGKAYTATMKSDLRNLSTAQEAYFYDNNAYASSVTNLNFTLSSGVSVVLGPGSSGGWAASATHVQDFSARCSVWYGTGTPIAPSTLADGEGTIICR